MSDAQVAAGAAAPALSRSILATCFGFALIQLDVTIVNVALPAIGTALGAGLSGLQWIVDAYALVFAATLLPFGTLSDRVGARSVYLGGMAVFTLASVVCGLATSPATMIAARIVQGFGAAAMLPSSLALLNHASGDDPRRRAWAIGWWTTAASTALASGPIIGGALIHLAGWRWIFLVNLPLGIVGLVFTLRLPDTGVRHGRRLDLPGQLLGIVTLALLTGATIEAGPRGLDPLVLGLAGLALATGAAFVFIERRVADPVLPAGMVTSPMVAVSLVVGAVVNLTYYGILFVLSLFLQRTVGLDAGQAGLAFLPLTATFIVVNLLSSWVAGRSGARLPMALGALVAAVGYALMARFDATTTPFAMLPAFVLLPAGMGFMVPAMISGVLAAVPRTQSGTVSAVLNAARQAGGVVGVALFGALASRDVAFGLRAAAITATVLMLGLAVLSAFGLREVRRPGAAGRGDLPENIL